MANCYCVCVLLSVLRVSFETSSEQVLYDRITLYPPKSTCTIRIPIHNKRHKADSPRSKETWMHTNLQHIVHRVLKFVQYFVFGGICTFCRRRRRRRHPSTLRSPNSITKSIVGIVFSYAHRCSFWRDTKCVCMCVCCDRVGGKYLDAMKDATLIFAVKQKLNPVNPLQSVCATEMRRKSGTKLLDGARLLQSCWRVKTENHLFRRQHGTKKICQTCWKPNMSWHIQPNITYIYW